MTTTYSRRTFLKLAAATSTVGLLAACQVPVAVQPEGGVPATQGNVVRILMPSWATAEIPYDTTAREFSEANPGTTIQIQTTTEGWETKVMSQIASDSLEWSGAGIASSASSSLPRWILTEMVQPMDDLLAASAVEGADTLLDDMIPVLREASTYEGKFYGIPYSYENISFNWRTDYFEAVGATEAPTNWDDWLEIARELKQWGADENIYPTAFIPDLDASVGTLIYGSTTEPFGEDTLLKWESEEAINALAFYRQLVLEEELTPPHGFDGWLDAYYAGKVASVQAQSSRGVWGQLAFGTEAVRTSPVPTRLPENAGTPFWGNCVALLNKAPNPQETVDYFVYTMGPQNTTFQKTVIHTGKTPVYQSVYDTIINGDPQFRTYAWMEDMRAQVERSVIRPFNNYFSIQDTHYRNFVVQLVEPGSTMTPEECAKAILEASKEEIAKQEA
jgi:ABC-type glycerol-3-phosphate transport system substrate-binding protein